MNAAKNTSLPVNTAKKQSGKPFKPGVSGNPSGRPQGSRNKATLALESLLDGQAEVLTQKAVDMALEGDMQALRLCLERIYPPRKSRPIEVELPKVETAKDVKNAQAAVIEAMAEGEITPDEASTVAGILDAKRRAIETVEMEERLAAIERATSLRAVK